MIFLLVMAIAILTFLFRAFSLKFTSTKWALKLVKDYYVSGGNPKRMVKSTKEVIDKAKKMDEKSIKKSRAFTVDKDSK